MVSVLIDACGWAALIDAGLNLDVSMRDVLGKPDYIVLDKVQEELDSLAQQRRGLLLPLLAKRGKSMANPEGIRHTDLMLIELSRKNRWPVLTVDRRLKERLIENGGSYVEVTSRRILRHVEN
jgi:rRNA-processing protein FCF1